MLKYHIQYYKTINHKCQCLKYRTRETHINTQRQMKLNKSWLSMFRKRLLVQRNQPKRLSAIGQSCQDIEAML